MSSPSQAAAGRWNLTLRCFRFWYAHGGHANDMDTLTAAIRFDGNESGLLGLFTRLGVPLLRIPPDMPRRQVGVSYDSADWDRFADPIPAFPAFAQPGFQKVLGMPASLAVSASEVAIYLSGADGNIWSVGEADYRNALQLEQWLPPRGIQLRTRPRLEDIERLYWALREEGLTDIFTERTVREELARKAGIALAAPDARGARIDAIRQAFLPALPDDQLWLEAHGELHAIQASALSNVASSHLLAHRFPGYSTELIDRVCADARFASR